MVLWSSALALLTFLMFPVACTRSRNRTVYAEVPTAGSLKEGSSVKFGGIDIGVVRSVTPLRSGARLELLIQRPDAPLQIDDRVAIHPVGVFGEETVMIVPGPTDGQPLRDGDSLRAAPPDSLAPVRDALARAIVHEFVERARQSDSTKAAKIAPPRGRL